MKREIFFWLEKLKITPAERKAVSAGMGFLMALSVGNILLSPSKPFEGEQYAELEKKFEHRTALLQIEEQKRTQRYSPAAKKTPALTVMSDTLPQKPVDKAPASEKPKTDKKDKKSRINVNAADQETLQTLPGIGPAYSKRIIAYRKQYGKFKTVEELKKIKGIGEKRLEKLKPFIKLKDSK